jgi:hypothetical protein
MTPHFPATLSTPRCDSVGKSSRGTGVKPAAASDFRAVLLVRTTHGTLRRSTRALTTFTHRFGCLALRGLALCLQS